MAVPILEPPVTRWHCPSCGALDTTRQHGPHTRMHVCAGLKGLTAPMVPEGVAAVHRANEREDFVRDELVATDDTGRPVMSVTTTRDDGEDVTVYAPTATGRLG